MIELIHDIATRIREGVPSLKTVDNPSIYMYALENKGPITPLLPACWITAGGGKPIANAQSGDKLRDFLPFTEEQDYELWLMLPHELDEANHTLTDQNASPLLSRIITLLHGWKPDSNRYHRKLLYAGRDTPDYTGDYAVYPLTFTARRNVTDAEA